MSLIISNLRIPVEKDGVAEYLKSAAEQLGLAEETITFVKMLSKSLDIADKEQFYFEISLVVKTPDNFANIANLPIYTEELKSKRRPIKCAEKPVIIGFGPAGIFAALEFLEHGVKPIIFERGKKIEERSTDIQRFIKERVLDPESNIQFGEGGAGSYSDGKLFSRLMNSEYTNRVLETFIRFGAPEEIAYIRKPHLGTDVLCRIVRNIRNHILERGGEIHYCSKLTDILISDDKVSGVVINGENEYHSSILFLAVGHSSRDTFEMLHKKGVVIEQKPITLGVRVEHPADIINLMRYGDKYKNYPDIGAATYSLNYNDRKSRRGVYTFCMCPGGEIVNASSENEMLVVNGMSYSGRSSAFSNAALVVTCHTDDYRSADPLAGLEFQKRIEQKAFIAGGGRWEVPAQNMLDFLCKKPSNSLNKNSCRTGTTAVQINELFPEFISNSLSAALNTWKKDYPLFVSDYAILFAAETRTSAPLKIKRNQEYESVNVKGLYPIGEGSGYTGGITSSAADAIKAVEATLSGIESA